MGSSEPDISKFINKMGTGLDTCFIHLLEFVRENVSIDGITDIQIIEFLQHSDRVGIRIRTGKQFTNYSQRKKRASTTGWHDTDFRCLYGLGIINLMENIPVKEKVRGDRMLQISLTLIVKMITGLEDLHELETRSRKTPS